MFFHFSFVSDNMDYCQDDHQEANLAMYGTEMGMRVAVEAYPRVRLQRLRRVGIRQVWSRRQDRVTQILEVRENLWRLTVAVDDGKRSST